MEREGEQREREMEKEQPGTREGWHYQSLVEISGAWFITLNMTMSTLMDLFWGGGKVPFWISSTHSWGTAGGSVGYVNWMWFSNFPLSHILVSLSLVASTVARGARRTGFAPKINWEIKAWLLLDCHCTQLVGLYKIRWVAYTYLLA